MEFMGKKMFLNLTLRSDACDQSDQNKQVLFEFFDRISEKSNTKSINFTNSVKILKKMLIYMIHTLRAMRSFLYLKTKMPSLSLETFGIQNLLNFCKSNPYDKIKSRLPIDSNLLSLTIDDLISLIDIRDIRTYIMLVRIDITPKETTDVKINYKGQILTFELSDKERREVLCGKTKQRDDLIKLAFDLIRKELLNEFKKNVMHKTNNFKISLVRRGFINEYFQNDPDAKDFMTTTQLPQPKPRLFSCFPYFTGLVRNFQKTKFFDRIINQIIFQGREQKKWKEEISFEEFYLKVFFRHFYGGYVLIDLINSLKYFCTYFNL
jgi:hypothetical protein